MLMYPDAGRIFGKDARRERPDLMLLACIDQGLEQGFTDFFTTMTIPDIDADLGDARVNTTTRNGGQGSPADNLPVFKRDKAAVF